MLVLSLIIIHIGLVYVYYRTRNELLELKASYNEERSRFNIEMNSTKKEITDNIDNLLELKALYNQEKSQFNSEMSLTKDEVTSMIDDLIELKIRHDQEKSKFSDEIILTKEKINNTVNKLLEFRHLVEKKDKEIEDLRLYLVKSTQRLEGRPEEIRREFKIYTKDNDKLVKGLLYDLNNLSKELNDLKHFTFSEVTNVKKHVFSNSQNKNKYL
jgi:hypothetical protein